MAASVIRRRARLSWLFLGIFGLFLLLPASTVVFAKALVTVNQGTDFDDWCETYDCMPVFDEIIDSELASRLRLYERQPIERFDLQQQPQECPLNRPLQPTYFALLIGPGYEGGPLNALRGPANDMIYLSQALKERGVAEDRMRMLTGAALDRLQIIQAMREMLACLRNGDQILFSFDGHAVKFPQLPARPIGVVVKEACELFIRLAKTGLCNQDASTSESWGELQRLYEAKLALAEKRNDGSFVTLLTNIEKGVTYADWSSGRRPVPGLMSQEITNFVNQARNLDADISIMIDTAYAAAMRPVTPSKPWLSAADGIALNRYDVRLTGRGQVAAFFAVESWAEAIERPMSPLGQVGVFSYLFSEALRKLPTPTIAELAAEIRAQYDAQPKTGGRVPQPVMHASDPELGFMPSVVKIEPNEKDIEIIQPALKRGAQSFEDARGEATLHLVARYVGKGAPYKAIIDGEVVDIDINGQFGLTMADASARASMDIRVLSRDFQTLAHRTLRLRLSDQDIILSSAGRKLALFIANQDYEDERFDDLQTPKADAEAIRQILIERYGFTTAIEREDGTALDLFLVNASRSAISRVLLELRRRLTKEDELIVYYAGHGDNVEGAGSYWIPVDGKGDEYFDWIDADDITTELRLMNARAILLISDSCYSGGLARGETAKTAAASEARDRYLAKARSFKSRQLIASGGEEPVEDGGGGGHSVFAKALIDGLTTIAGDAFTASELLEQKIKPAVVSSPTALSERQIPGFHRIAKAGDEIGSEFIFVRKDAARQAAGP
ncbi:MAG: caspase family protein [Parvibaculaceae bacterium]